MNIGIIGSGSVGSALARGAGRAGHQVVISSSDRESARHVAASADAVAAKDNCEVASSSDLIILAVPFAAVNGIGRELGDGLSGKVLIDVTNRMDPLTLTGESNAEQIQSQIPKAKVVKAFNTIFAAHMADPSVDGLPLDGFVAADDVDARQTVLRLVQSMGFRPIDAGGLVMARALEGMALLNIALNIKNNWPWQSGWKLVGPVGETGV